MQKNSHYLYGYKIKQLTIVKTDFMYIPIDNWQHPQYKLISGQLKLVFFIL